MDIQTLKSYVLYEKGKKSGGGKLYGWIIQRKDLFLYFKHRDTTRPNNQGKTYSLKTKDFDEAFQTLIEWEKNGLPDNSKKNSITFVDFLYSFWDEQSEYVMNTDREGRHITKDTIKKNRGMIKHHVEDFFSGKYNGFLLSDVNEDVLNAFFDNRINIYVSPKYHRKLSTGFMHKLKTCVIVPLKWARKKKIITQFIDFDIVCPNLGYKQVYHRGILTEAETYQLLKCEWDNQIAYIAFYIAVNCGLRLGEIRGLKIGKIKENCIYVTNSYNDTDKLKTTKTRVSRIVPCTSEVYESVQKFIRTLPFSQQQPECYLLANPQNPTIPVDENFCTRYFYKALERCGIERQRINEENGQVETIVFHSLRHQTATRWMSAGLDQRKVAKAMGHSPTQLQTYSNHFEVKDAERFGEELKEANVLGIDIKDLMPISKIKELA